MVTIINTSVVIADLLPEVCHSFDPDMPYMEVGLSDMVRKHLRDMVLHAFFHRLSPDQCYASDWLQRLRTDRFLNEVATKRWVDIEIVDTEGTYVIIFEDIS